MRPLISIIIPAYNEEERLPKTLMALSREPFWDELLVIDDGSSDRTCQIPLPVGGRWIIHPRNLGKGRALKSGIEAARGEILLLLDADLEESAQHAKELILPVLEGAADAVVAQWPSGQKKDGFGIVKRFAQTGVYLLTHRWDVEPLSGQRCYHRRIIPSLSLQGKGFGIEVSMDIDLLSSPARIMWLPLPFTHRQRGRGLDGFLHRGRQGKEILNTLCRYVLRMKGSGGSLDE